MHFAPNCRTKQRKRKTQPLPGGSASLSTQRTISDSPSLGCVENLAFRLHWALRGTHSSRVVRLSTICTLPMGWWPTLSRHYFLFKQESPVTGLHRGTVTSNLNNAEFASILRMNEDPP